MPAPDGASSADAITEATAIAVAASEAMLATLNSNDAP